MRINVSEQKVELKDIKLLPNLWTSVQFITLPLMIYFAWMQNFKLFITFYLLTFFIDSTDGIMARYFGLTSKLGMYLDTYLDFAMYLSVAVCLYWFMPEFLSSYVIFLVVIFLVTVVSRVYSVVRFGRALMLHLYSSKLMYGLLTLFIAHYYFTRLASDVLFIILLIDAAIFVVEEFLIVMLLKTPREDILTVWDVLSGKKS